MTDDATLQRQFRAARDRVPATRDACIEVGDLAAAAQRADSETARLIVLDHVATCATCRHEFDLLRTVAETKPRTTVRWARWGTVAAGLAAAVTLVLWRGRAEPASPPYRGPDVSVTLHEPAVDSAQVVLAWQPVEGATRYLVEVIRSDGTSAASMELPDTLATIPRSSLGSATDFRWTVQASLRDGRVVESAFRPLRLTK